MWSSQRPWRRQRWRTLLGRLMYGSSDIKLCRQLSHFECKSSACWGRNRWWPIRISNCVVALEGTAIYIIHPILDTWTSELGPGIHAYSFRDHDPVLNRNQGHSFFLPHRTFHSSAFTLNTFQFLTAIELLLLMPHAPCCFYFASVDTLWGSLVLQCFHNLFICSCFRPLLYLQITIKIKTVGRWREDRQDLSFEVISWRPGGLSTYLSIDVMSMASTI